MMRNGVPFVSQQQFFRNRNPRIKIVTNVLPALQTRRNSVCLRNKPKDKKKTPSQYYAHFTGRIIKKKYVTDPIVHSKEAVGMLNLYPNLFILENQFHRSVYHIDNQHNLEILEDISMGKMSYPVAVEIKKLVLAKDVPKNSEMIFDGKVILQVNDCTSKKATGKKRRRKDNTMDVIVLEPEHNNIMKELKDIYPQKRNFDLVKAESGILLQTCKHLDLSLDKRVYTYSNIIDFENKKDVFRRKKRRKILKKKPQDKEMVKFSGIKLVDKTVRRYRRYDREHLTSTYLARKPTKKPCRHNFERIKGKASGKKYNNYSSKPPSDWQMHFDKFRVNNTEKFYTMMKFQSVDGANVKASQVLAVDIHPENKNKPASFPSPPKFEAVITRFPFQTPAQKEQLKNLPPDQQKKVQESFPTKIDRIPAQIGSYNAMQLYIQRMKSIFSSKGDMKLVYNKSLTKNEVAKDHQERKIVSGTMNQAPLGVGKVTVDGSKLFMPKPNFQNFFKGVPANFPPVGAINIPQMGKTVQPQRMILDPKFNSRFIGGDYRLGGSITLGRDGSMFKDGQIFEYKPSTIPSIPLGKMQTMMGKQMHMVHPAHNININGQIQNTRLNDINSMKHKRKK